MGRRLNVVAIAVLTGMISGGAVISSAPAEAQQRGTGVITGGVATDGISGGPGQGMRGGGAGGSRGAMMRSGGLGFQRGAIGPGRFTGGPSASNRFAGAHPLTVSPGRRYLGRSDFDRRGRGWYGAGIGLAAAPFFSPWFAGDSYDPYYYDPGYGGYDPYYPAAGPIYYPEPTYESDGPLGDYCATPQKTCQLYDPAPVGIGCSCRAPAGQPRYRGQVAP